MGDAVWMLVAALALACAVLAWLLLRKRRPEAAPLEPEVVSPSIVEKPAPPAVAVAAPPAVSVPPSPPLTPPPVQVAATPVPPSNVVAAPPAPPTTRPPRTVTQPSTPVVARAPRFVLLDGQAEAPVMLLERAGAELWAQAAPLEPTPMQREALAALLVHADRLDPPPAGADGAYRIRLRAGVALPLARGELAGAPGGELRSEPEQAIDPASAAGVAAIMLALHCGPAYLGTLRVRVTETKSLAATLHPKLLAHGDGKLKALLQDLTRYLREAEENYAGAIRKPVFLARIADTCGQAEVLWRQLGDGVSAARAQLGTQAGAPRFGEVQLERSLAALRELQGQRRVQDVAARVLAGWHALRLALGDATPAAAAALRSAAEGLSAGVAADRAIGERLAACLDGAKVPDYVGKAEFIAHREAARELLQKIAAESLDTASQALDGTSVAIDAGFAGMAPMDLLLQLDAQGHLAELRSAPLPA